MILNNILENIGELIETDHNNNIRQVRFSNRLDFVSQSLLARITCNATWRIVIISAQ